MKENIKAIIFDLDNTLHDNEFLTNRNMIKTVKSMIETGMKCNLNDGVKKLKEIINKNPSSDKIKELATSFDSHDKKIIEAGVYAYQHPEFDELIIYPETKEVLDKLKNKYKLVLISQGAYDSQEKRIDVLGIRNYFDYIYLPETGKKRDSFNIVLNELNFHPEEILVVGDRIDSEIKIGKELGMKTCRVMRGKYKIIEPRIKTEEPDYVVNTLRGLYNILNLRNDIKIVLIGGGTGTSALLEGLKKYTDDITAVVSVTDTGRSSGLIRKDFNILAPGDVRNCLIALSNSEKLMCDLFQYRINNGNLKGYSFGNLFIAALSDITGSFENAIEEASKILKLKGRVLPSTFDNVNICAELEDGTILKEENEIIDRNNENVFKRSPIKKVFHNIKAKANKKIIESIKEADLIVLSPGSLYTSIISNLLVSEIPETISASKAKKVYVCNIMSQVSQTYNYKASDHVKKILEYLNSDLDFVILNNKNPSEELIKSYKSENAHLIENDIEEIEKIGIRVILGDLLDDVKEKKLLWEKKNLLRHDPDKIARVLVGLI
jgi:uncharacterized cofD-like protein/HAD superfamily hydrolase (TIGR01549 family)